MEKRIISFSMVVAMARPQRLLWHNQSFAHTGHLEAAVMLYCSSTNYPLSFNLFGCLTAHESSLSRSSKSSSSQPPFLLCTVNFSASCCCSLTEVKMSFSCASVIRLRSCPLRASVTSLFSTSSALDALTRRIRPSRSAASGSRICESMELRASASRFLSDRTGSVDCVEYKTET